MKKIIGSLLLFLIAFPALALDQDSRRQEPSQSLQTLLASKAIDPDQTAIYIWDLEADYQLAAHRQTQPIVPASVMKCVTTAALAAVQPYDARIRTRVYLEGKKDGDSFVGKLIAEGAGDPSLADGRFPQQPDFIGRIVEALLSHGIRNISGEIIAEDSGFVGPAVHPSWMAADLDLAYGTGVHAFNFEGNSSGKKAVTDPGAVFRRKLTAALKESGIEFSQTADAHPSNSKRQLLLEYESPRLGELMRSCMFRSDNLYAEAFLRLFGLQNGADGSPGLSAEIAMQHWDALNYPVDSVEIADGSGLSRDNRLTAEFLGTVLRSGSDDPEYVAFFPLAGEEGTVKGFMKDTPLQGRLALKTGSMNGIQSYAGYLLDEDYMPTHVVVAITNGLKNRSQFRSALASFFLALFTR